MKDRLWISTFLFVISFRGEWSTSVGGKSEHECQLPRLLHRGVGGRVRVGNKEVGHCWNLGDSCLLISLFKNCRFSRKFVLTDITAKCPLLQKTHTVLQMISLLNYYFTYFIHVAQWQTCNKCDIWCLLTPWPFRFVDEVLQKKVNISLWKPKWITFSLWIG